MACGEGLRPPEPSGPRLYRMHLGSRCTGDSAHRSIHRMGFLDAFNPSFPVSGGGYRGLKDAGWVDPDYIGIDEGPILAMIENYRSELIWCVMHGDPYLRQASSVQGSRAASSKVVSGRRLHPGRPTRAGARATCRRRSLTTFEPTAREPCTLEALPQVRIPAHNAPD